MKLIKFLRKNFIITIALTLLLLRAFFFIPVIVEGSSMYPTLIDGQKGVSLRRYIQPSRFDIVVIKISNKLLVKRVIGLPGETVEYKNSKLYIDGIFVEEDFLNNVKTDDFQISLSKNEYYCLGDNREHSSDSRFYGPFILEDIIATKFFNIP